MKNIFKILLIVFALGAVSCESWIDPEINVDPSNPVKVTLSLLLPQAEGGIAYSAGGELSRYTGYWTQQITGIANHAARHETYSTNEADVENLWKFYTYAGTLMDLRTLIDQAMEESSPHYAGVAKILMAYKLGVTSDMWGDVPYEDAFQGADGNITATYQTQEQIYTILFSLLNDGIEDLAKTESVTSPGEDDLIYEGDLEKWTMAAYGLKARFSIHLSKRNGNAAYTDALAAIPNAFASSADNFSFMFGTAKVENAPLFQYDEQRTGYIGGVGKFMVDLLKNGGDTDPRLAVYADTIVGGTYEGFLPGATSAGASWIGDMFTKADATVALVTYAEVKFIEAEANHELGNLAEAATAYNDAVKGSLEQFGLMDTEADGYADVVTWIAANAAETAGTISLETIMKGKYIALFLQDETFCDWRRHTSIYNLSLAAGAATTEIPRRFPYAQSEREYNNDNMPQGLTLTDRVWWDAN